jgi:hypothetical protein
MNTALAQPREGSPASCAIKAIKLAGGSIPEDRLADALEITRLEVNQKLSYPIRMGLIKRSVFGGNPYYSLGPDAATAGIDLELSPANTAGLPPVVVAELSKRGRAQVGELEPEPCPAPPPQRPQQIRRTVQRIPAQPGSDREFIVPRFLDEGAAADLVSVVHEAANAAGLDVPKERRPTVTVARELVSSVMSALQVGTLELARYTDGRVLIEIDGVSGILPPALAEKARDFFAP